jgi:hypothetical protein
MTGWERLALPTKSLLSPWSSLSKIATHLETEALVSLRLVVAQLILSNFTQNKQTA